MFDWLNWFGFIDYDLNPDLVDWLGIERENLSFDRVLIDDGGKIHFQDEMEF